jgi:outer membrane protein insertion porin family
MRTRLLLPRPLLLAAAVSVGASPGTARAVTVQHPPDLRVASVEVLGAERLDPPVRVPRLPLRAGGPYTAERVEASVRLIALAVAESGHPYADVEVSADVDQAAGTAAVVFAVDPGPRAVFGAVDVQAPPPFRERDIRARVAFEPGERFRPSAIERTRRAILALPGVEDVAVELPGLDHGAITLAAVIRVARPDRMADVGGRATLSSAHCLEVAGAWRHRHFLDGPRLFTISGGLSNLFAGLGDGGFPCPGAGQDAYAQPNYFLTTEIFQPIAADPAIAVQVRGFFRRRTAPQAYLLHGFGLHTTLFRNLGTTTQLRAAYLPERNEVRAAGHYFCINFGACDAASIRALSGPRRLAPVEAGVQWMPPAAREPFGPAWVREAGLWPGALGPFWRPMLRVDLGGAARITGSDYEYLRGEAEASVARVLTPRTEAAVRLRLGAVAAGSGILPPQARFYSGGPTTLRGARQNLLDPLVLVAAPAPSPCSSRTRR